MASKKAQKKKNEKVIEDATFGLKNKNKSKKVQDFIQRVEKTVKNSSKSKDAEKMKEAKQASKLAKQLADEELRALFNEGLTNQFGKKKSKASEDAKALGVAETSKDVQDLMEDLGLDDSSDEEEGGEKRQTIYIDDLPTAVEVFREKTIEDLIEEQRARLAAEGRRGTPVTAETFAKWRADKLARKQAEAEARLKAEQSKKKGSKGLSVLSGKELFNFNASLFVDDDGAIDETEERALNEETRQVAEEEERVEKQEAARAQEEQERLQEMERRYMETLLYRQEELKQKAHRVTVKEKLKLDDVLVNPLLFSVQEGEGEGEEDLEPFVDEVVVLEQQEAEEKEREREREKENGKSVIE
eukprot:CAMPEP_0182425472 /NCGR_PEP_ID=MMETSP1167-20130531/11910_1 /TAXON_ID=2988 /ORGANISM="Mallomonas Sp, Strain CCMP3275" /LENGTH=357 /DNA_ID=CAMNT_0024606233 /DNA_START=156 /DNA_END=1226 /DNA_ORIENTATION=+